MSAGQDNSLRELAETLRYELQLQGVPGSLHVGAFPDVLPERVYVILDPLEYARTAGRRGASGSSNPRADDLRVL